MNFLKASAGKTLDHVTKAVHQILDTGDMEAWKSVWAEMDEQARGQFDAFLVHMGDPLAFTGGGGEIRFRARCQRMASTELDRRFRAARS